MGESDRKLFYAIVGCAVVMFALALPALVVGSIALARMNMPPATASSGSTLLDSGPTTTATVNLTDFAKPAPTVSAVFEYSGELGPDKWGEINPAWEKCAKGRYQSPIDIRDSETTPPNATNNDATPLTMSAFTDTASYLPGTNPFKNKAKIFHDGHSIKTSSPLSSYFTFKDKTYQQQQFHFHTPSENLIEGFSSAAEIHMVHQSLAGELLVIGIMVEEGATSPPFILDLMAKLPATMASKPSAPHTSSKPELFELNIGTMLDNIGIPPSGSTKFWTWAGSLTTPPCSEGVTWILLKDKITMTAAHISALKNAGGENARPVQPRNSRTVFSVQ